MTNAAHQTLKVAANGEHLLWFCCFPGRTFCFFQNPSLVRPLWYCDGWYWLWYQSFGLAAALPRDVQLIYPCYQINCSVLRSTENHTETKLGPWKQTSSQNTEQYGPKDRARKKNRAGFHHLQFKL